MSLHQKRCIPCKIGTPPLTKEEIAPLLEQLGKGWEVVEEKMLKKTFSFPNFEKALAFTNRVGKIAEEEGHHPDIHLSWGKVVLELWTHKAHGLTENDFILASKCDAV